jgi:hypothetical protein
MLKKLIVFFALSFILTGCFESGPEDTATLTTPVTNNPHALPIKGNPMPNVF